MWFRCSQEQTSSPWFQNKLEEFRRLRDTAGICENRSREAQDLLLQPEFRLRLLDKTILYFPDEQLSTGEYSSTRSRC